MDRTKIPHPDNLIPTLQNILRNDGYKEIAEKLEGVICYYSDNYFTFPKIRSFGLGSAIKSGQNLNIEVLSANLNFFDNTRRKQIILKYANKILKPECRYEFVELNISPQLVPVINGKDDGKEFDSDIEFDKNPFKGNEKHTIPEDIINNSKEMSQNYQLVYIIENVLRHYIDKKCLSSFGENYLEKIELPVPIPKKLQYRIKKDKINIWTGSKRDSHLYLLDMLDLSKIIVGNWELFKTDFPSMEWIKMEIDKINECRKLIAHNNDSLAEHSKDVLITSSKSILKQLKYLE